MNTASNSLCKTAVRETGGRDTASNAPSETAVRETHISTIFLNAGRAYKLFKPVALGFLDYSNDQVRIEAVQNELEQNRRFAPEVYLGTADVTERGVLVDRMLVMERMPEDRRLTQLLNLPGEEIQIRSIARSIAAFHAKESPASDACAVASRDAVGKNWADNFATMEPFIPAVLDAESVGRVRRLVDRYLGDRDELFARRISSGQVKDGHGDLRAEDIFCLPTGPQILDCLAFSRRLRVADVLSDVAFLAMDLDRLAGPRTARQFMNFYSEFSNEHHPTSLAHHYVAYRAHVRCKVALLRFSQGSSHAAVEAREYHELCLRHLERAAVRLVLVGGAPGTGKSTLSKGLGEAMGWVVLNSDELRKDLVGLGHEEHARAGFEEGIYAPEVTAQLYGALLDQAAMLMARGESVIIDASWPVLRSRRDARLMAEFWGASLLEFECVADPEITHQRVARRNRTNTDGASDATPETFVRALAAREPWPTARAVSTDESAACALDYALAHTVAPV